MLTHLKISNLAIIDDLELECCGGLTIVTGETGAGKSIVLDALNLALGSRADSSLVRHGSDKADVLASFDIYRIKEAQQWLQERELDSGDDCILRRVVTNEGRSRGYINGKPCPLQDLKVLGSMLISIHGQHEHQRLLDQEHHRQLLDDSAGLQQIATETQTAYQQWQKNKRALHKLRGHLKESSDRIDLLTFQVGELNELALGEEELPQLVTEHKRLANSEEIITSCQNINSLLSNDEAQGAVDLLHNTLTQFDTLPDTDPELKSVQEMLNSALINAQEALDGVHNYLDGFDADPQKFQELDNRLGSIHQMARKHRVPPEQLHQLHQDLASELGTLENGDEELAELEKQCDLLFHAYLDKAQVLSKKRRTAAKKLSKAISKEISVLGMPHGKFEISLTTLEEDQYNSAGLEKVEFLVTSNPGQPLKPLQKTASGGELSRISLAIQVVCAQNTQISTLVFDEVDVGISGAIAQVVGRLLRDLGQQGQILCITHLPQVASQGHQHLHINKTTSKKTTRTHINELNEQEKVVEIAKMLGGVELTDQSLANAKELLAQRA